ncbi:MAG: hypothetical protein ABIR58_09740 [Gemmatimonadaceae bacterium]
MTTISARLPVFVLALAFLAGCAQGPLTSEQQPPQDSPPGSNTGVMPGTKEGDWSAIEQIEAQAKAIAKTSGCTASSQCRTAPVGNRACGGPRYYLPYCAATTDSAALFAKLAEVAKAENEYNRKYGLASTCEFRMPPLVEAVAGSCVAKQ